jgi:hypothetical protein
MKNLAYMQCMPEPLERWLPTESHNSATNDADGVLTSTRPLDLDIRLQKKTVKKAKD